MIDSSNQRLHVALLHFCFEDYTIELANGLVDRVRLTLIAPESVAIAYQNVLDPRIQVHTFAKPRIRDPRNLFSMGAMMKLIRAVNPDVLHVQETNDPWYDLTLLFNKMPPLVTTIHDVFRHPGDRQSVFGSEYTRRIAFYKSQQLIVHAHQLQQALVTQFSVSETRVNVIPHGELGNLYLRRAGGIALPREPHTILFFGRIWPYKGLNYLLAAMPLVIQQIPDVKLIIAGRGESLQTYLPNGYDPCHYEIWNDFIPFDKVAGLFQRSTAVILPYIEASQSGVATIAYATGTPMIASAVGGLKEVIYHEQDGLLVPPGDSSALAESIVRLLRDQSLQKTLQAGALARCQTDLNWSNIALQTVHVYRQAML